MTRKGLLGKERKDSGERTMRKGQLEKEEGKDCEKTTSIREASIARTVRIANKIFQD